ncbi:hypothetical protein MN608_10859 [Microdochium nivale]|nr:hypothetical protein MN608_10859 [Microdochium nivale]
MEEQSSTLLRLPAELRGLVWDIYYTALSPPHASHVTTGTSIADVASHVTCDIDLAPARVCKLFHSEVWPSIWRHCRLDFPIPPPPHSSTASRHRALSEPSPPSVPAQLAGKIQRVAWHSDRGADDGSGAPGVSLLLRRFPSLRELTVCCAAVSHIAAMPLHKGLDVEEMALPSSLAVAASGPRPRRKSSEKLREEAVRLYYGMSEHERIAQWLASGAASPAERVGPIRDESQEELSAVTKLVRIVVADSGRGGGEWLRELLRSPDGQSVDEAALAPHGDSDRQVFGSTTAKVQVKLEIELYLMGGGPWFGIPTPVVPEALLFVVDVRRREIESMRQLRPEEHDFRQKTGLSPYDDEP